MTKSAIPVRLQTMTHDQKARRIMELEDALQKTNERIAAAVAAKQEQCAKECEDFALSATIGESKKRAMRSCAAAIRALK